MSEPLEPTPDNIRAMSAYFERVAAANEEAAARLAAVANLQPHNTDDERALLIRAADAARGIAAEARLVAEQMEAEADTTPD